MIEHLWIPITVAAAALQCARIAFQRQLARTHGNVVAAYVRYLFGAPIVLLALVVPLGFEGGGLPALTPTFLLYCLVAGLAQIGGTVLMLQCFETRSFAVGATLSKTETLQVAMLTPVLLGDALGVLAWAGIVVSVFGVVALSLKRDLQAGWRLASYFDRRSTVIGLLSGFLLAVCSIHIRKASLELPGASWATRGVMCLVVITWLQFALMLPMLFGERRRRVSALRSHPALTAGVAATSAVGSLGWFVATALQTSARVQAVGQIGLVFVILTSWMVFREKPSRPEILGMVLVVAGILAVIGTG